MAERAKKVPVRYTGRTASVKEVAKALDINAATVLALAARGMPHDSAGGRRKKLFDINEVKAWFFKNSDIRGPKEESLPLAEARPRLRKIKELYDFTVPQFAKAIQVKASRLRQYLYTRKVGRSTLKNVPLRIVLDAEGLRHKDPTVEEKVKNALTTSVSKNEAARKLKMGIRSLNSNIKKYKLDNLVKSYKAAERISKRKIIAVLKETRGQIKQVLTKLKISKSVLYRLLKEANVDPEKFRGVTKGDLTEALVNANGVRKMAAKDLDISYAGIKILIKKYNLDRVFPAPKAPKRRKSKS